MLKLMVFNVCVLLELSDSLCAGVVTACVCVCSCRNVCFAANLLFDVETMSFTTNDCAFCSEIVICCRNCVVYSELAFIA